ncbi:hypothetical protein NDA11_002620 [Ustilago hordei]|uniref:Uncharacterized protein n=1 Tax=Ustilago hordei TaxID=120017 RepID=I2G245_USTHO|nr:uncharacterized protein UHO2_02610 [Ustilago hordei]KAJ1040289.1 hypothetical protein NDA10_002709 [Ustilago hordei]KAJ1585242.1 hypothetical protein NDA15_004421 [Ustilago hordei]KAJ1587794.1 hypothetical protein NDA12_000792 [Ustilago hordei]KAJ1592868.1 hypothetical protein NDA11_002620 [Ustilago hordei]KAJ1601312.1 hypothetical protein NDA14_001233 [Ustilago hordei]
MRKTRQRVGVQLPPIEPSLPSSNATVLSVTAASAEMSLESQHRDHGTMERDLKVLTYTLHPRVRAQGSGSAGHYERPRKNVAR